MYFEMLRGIAKRAKEIGKHEMKTVVNLGRRRKSEAMRKQQQSAVKKINKRTMLE